MEEERCHSDENPIPDTIRLSAIRPFSHRFQSLLVEQVVCHEVTNLLKCLGVRVATFLAAKKATQAKRRLRWLI